MGHVEIPRTSLDKSGMIKISKSGYNDQRFQSNCVPITVVPKPLVCEAIMTKEDQGLFYSNFD